MASLFDYQIIPSKFQHLTPFSSSSTFRLPLTLKPNYLSSHSRLFIVKSSQLSLNDSANPDTRKGYIWVNPKSPRAAQLRKLSYDSRYSSLVEVAHSLDSCDATHEGVSKVLFGLGENVVEQDAVIVLNNMKNPNTALVALQFFQNKIKLVREVVLYNVTLKVLRKGRELDRAEKLFDEMLQRGVKPDNVTFSTIISCCRLCYLPHKAVEWFEKMPAFGCDPDDVTYSAMIDAYGRAGNVDRAFALYDRARTERWMIDAVTFSTLIKIYGKTGNFDGCLNVYEEMKALGAKPNLVIYNTLLDAMGRAKRPWQAKIIFKEMTNNGVSPNWGTYAALLRAFCRARYGDDALKTYKEMKDKGLELNVILYNSLLAMCADLAYVKEAVQIYEEMKSSGTFQPDSWTFSSMITVYSCNKQVAEAENVLNEMVESGFEPNIFVLTSLIQCYGKANRTDDVVSTFDRVLELGITPDDRFCGCLLNVMTQTPKEELNKLIECIVKANEKLGNVVKILLEAETSEEHFKGAASELFDSISTDVKKAYCNCLIDLCVNLNMLNRACELLDLGLTFQIYRDLQSRTPTQWSLHLKSLSLGAALTLLHVWTTDLEKAIESGEELPPLLGINTGHGKHKYSEKGLAGVIVAHLKKLNAPFHEAPDKLGWFLTTKAAAQSWLESRKFPEQVSG
ncbi:pentatricopeptide repeat-containing protein At4g16390, chloroplastic-like [Chenopodium quinoa]|uniref:pentatricopeptide repeat-containing protein At4g16390, chloroplastic-like n=1 Tax=Chenopodium quinoa TaxID=63459 RepID=UPI000B791886|nr:pentatricopeptide repeat-containing protein At4g16390, chloroplastic-like [Chenopodium quinoa]